VSTLRVNTISDFSGGSSNLNIPGTAKAWVNFNGTGTVAIRASLNVSSITDNGTGDYTVNFATAMVDASYSVSGSVVGTTVPFNSVVLSQGTSNTTSSCRLKTSQGWGGSALTNFDCEVVSVSIFR